MAMVRVLAGEGRTSRSRGLHWGKVAFFPVCSFGFCLVARFRSTNAAHETVDCN